MQIYDQTFDEHHFETLQAARDWADGIVWPEMPISDCDDTVRGTVHGYSSDKQVALCKAFWDSSWYFAPVAGKDSL